MNEQSTLGVVGMLSELVRQVATGEVVVRRTEVDTRHDTISFAPLGQRTFRKAGPSVTTLTMELHSTGKAR